MHCAGTLGKGASKRSEQWWVTGTNSNGVTNGKKVTSCCAVEKEEAVGVT